MPHSGLQEAAYVALGEYTAIVQAMTWGHLAPKPKKAYSGWFLFTEAAYGGAIEIIESEFKDLPDSPWLYDDMADYAVKFVEQFFNTEIDSAGLYIFEGFYIKSKNGNYKFSGETKKIDILSLLQYGH
ncbi:MAG: hypothetical protein PHT07_21150 [Paludibacter sp.]|nr:hypothetical protein [Paludibacter sp.]